MPPLIRYAAFFISADVAVIAVTHPAAADQWVLQPIIQQQMKYDDNVLLTPRDEKSGFASVTTPELTISRLGDRLNLSLDGQFRFTNYFDHSEFNSDDQLLHFNGSYLASERSTLQLLADFNRDTSLTSDLNDSGTFLTKLVRVTSVNVAPSWKYLLSERDTLTLAGGFNQVQYDTNQLTDYRNYTASTTYDHQLTELLDFNAIVDYQRFEPTEGNTVTTDTVGFLVGLDYHPSERLDVGAAAGANYAFAESSGGKNGNSNQAGYRLKLNATYLLDDQTTLTAVYSHDREPSSSGELVNRNRVKVGLSYKLTPLVTLAFAGSYYDNADPLTPSEGTTEAKTQSYTLNPSVSWQFSESWSLTGSYAYRQKLAGSGKSSESATSNAAFITLKYSPLGFRWSE